MSTFMIAVLTLVTVIGGAMVGGGLSPMEHSALPTASVFRPEFVSTPLPVPVRYWDHQKEQTHTKVALQLRLIKEIPVERKDPQRMLKDLVCISKWVQTDDFCWYIPPTSPGMR